MHNKEMMTPYLDLTILVCLHFNRIGSLVKSMVPPLKLELFSPAIDSGIKIKHEVNVKQSKVYLLTYWILFLASPVFFFFSPASTLGVWPLT